MRPRFAFLLLPLFAGFLFIACQNEGEGQPCDTNAGNAGNDDCQSPLVCTTGLANANSPNPTPPEASTDTSTAEGGSPEATADGPIESATEAGPETGTGAETGSGNDASDGATSEAAGD